MALVAMYYFSSKAIEKFQDENSSVTVDQQPEESLNESVDASKVEVQPGQAQGSFWKNILAFTQRKKETFDSIYDVEKPKVQNFSLKNDASTLGFAVFLSKDQLGLNLSYEQQSDVYQNTLIV